MDRGKKNSPIIICDQLKELMTSLCVGHNSTPAGGETEQEQVSQEPYASLVTFAHSVYVFQILTLCQAFCLILKVQELSVLEELLTTRVERQG
jgi:hypothetical protein